MLAVGWARYAVPSPSCLAKSDFNSGVHARLRRQRNGLRWRDNRPR